MAQYKIVGTYRIMDVDPNPDVVVAPNPSNPTSSYSFSVADAAEFGALVLLNAQIKAAGTSSTAAIDAAVLAAVDGDPAT